MKGPIIVVLLFLAIIIGYTVITMPEEEIVVEEEQPFNFEFSVNEYGLLDSGGNVRGYLTARIVSQSAENATIDMMLFPNPTKKQIYKISDYASDDDKQAIMSDLAVSLIPYNLDVQNIYLEDALDKEDSVIIIPSDAMPDQLSSGELVELIRENTVIFFGKPLDITLEHSGSQEFIGNDLYEELDIYIDDGIISPKINGPKVFAFGNATVMEYEDGWFVVYDESLLGGDSGKEMAQLILKEGWQSERIEDLYHIPEMDGAKSLFTSPAEPDDYYMRLIYGAYSSNDSERGLIDVSISKISAGSLIMDEVSSSNNPVPYEFELHDNLTYPVLYDFSLQFVRDGEVIDTVDATSVTMKTFARETGSVTPDITAGKYVVRMADQNGRVHAMAYTTIPELKVKLVRIADNTHIFHITINGEPAVSTPLTLTVNERDSFELSTDKKGETKVAFMLAPGTHSFTVEMDGETATTYYKKAGDTSNLMLYAALVFGSFFVLGVIVLKSKRKRKWAVKTFHRPSSASRTLKIPHEVFLKLFKMIQDDRAKELPLSVTDMRMGLRKHATYKGAPLFVTDSNLYMLLDSMAKKGKFLSYGGYFLPKESTSDKPIEYWVIKRKLTDYFVENGEELKTSNTADFLVRGKMIHIWHDMDPKTLVGLCKKADNIIIFPDSKTRESFKKMTQKHDPNWMKLSLELQYGRLYGETLDEFLERGFSGKS